MSFGKMDDFSLSDLAGSGAIILASLGGLLTVILSSRCYIKCRLGLTDNCNLCMCERKPPPDPENPEQQEKKKEEEEEEKEPIVPSQQIKTQSNPPGELQTPTD